MEKFHIVLQFYRTAEWLKQDRVFVAVFITSIIPRIAQARAL